MNKLEYPIIYPKIVKASKDKDEIEIYDIADVKSIKILGYKGKYMSESELEQYKENIDYCIDYNDEKKSAIIHLPKDNMNHFIKYIKIKYCEDIKLP